jgi:hypothetical protein
MKSVATKNKTIMSKKANSGTFSVGKIYSKGFRTG